MTDESVTAACQSRPEWRYRTRDLGVTVTAELLLVYDLILSHPMGLRDADRERPTPFPSPENSLISE